jgi:hypothetical protein
MKIIALQFDSKTRAKQAKIGRWEVANLKNSINNLISFREFYSFERDERVSDIGSGEVEDATWGRNTMIDRFCVNISGTLGQSLSVIL